MRSEFTETLREGIAASGLHPMGAVAKELGVSQGQLSKWLSGVDIPKDDKAQALADFLDEPLTTVVILLHKARIEQAHNRAVRDLDEKTADELGISAEELASTDPEVLVGLLENRTKQLLTEVEQVISSYRADPDPAGLAGVHEALARLTAALARAQRLASPEQDDH